MQSSGPLLEGEKVPRSEPEPGAGGGAVTQVLTKGGSIKVPAETLLTFQLDKPVKIVQTQ